ncbi:MAG: HAMP domain-containing histidine kinase, partial [Anaerolineae bacterium]|nr:HAMP domain-containing histidine kinase [Anaerolineae bacterium]
MFASLRSRLWLTYAVVIAVVLSVVALALVIYLLRNPLLSREAAAKLRIAANALQRDRFTEFTPDRLEMTAQRIDENFDVRVIVISSDGSILVDSRAGGTIPALAPAPLQSDPPPIRTFKDQDGQSWLYSIQPLTDRRQLIVATPRPRVPVISILTDDLFNPLMQAGVIALLLSLLLALLISRWVAAPLQRMAAAARAVASGQHQPLELEGRTEVRSLGRAFNEMTTQLNASQQSQRDFVANVSHELKTPLTSVQGFAQAILDGTASDPHSLQKSAQVIYHEAGRMHRLVIDLLDLARLDAGTADLQRAP